MSVKGKEKAEDPVTIEELNEEEDDSANFFMKKRRRVVVRQPSIVKAPVERTQPAPIESNEDDDEPPERKRPVKAKKETNALPEWARTSTQLKRKASETRGGSADAVKDKGKAKETVIVIDSSPEPDSPERQQKSREKELTPPPEMSEEKKALIAQIIRSRHELPPAEDLEDDTLVESSSSSRPSASAVEDSVQLTFRMVAPPERKAEASAKAIEHFEKKRVITCGRTQPINYAVQAFAGQVRKAPADIVITFQGRKIFSRLLTPQRIGVDYEGEFVCYEKEFWDQCEAARLAHEAEEESKKEADWDRAGASSDSEPAAANDGKVRIILSDGEEDISATVAPHVLAKSLVKYFFKRSVNSHTDPPESYRLRFDGELVEPETEFQALDADEGDKIEIVKV